MIHGTQGRALPDHLAIASPLQTYPEAIAVLGPGYPDTGPCYACGADHDQPCAPMCETNRAR